MSSSIKHIRVVSDGRPGHENQSAGLAAAISRRTRATIETARFEKGSWLWARCRKAASKTQSVPDLLIGAGHKVHLPLWFAARAFRAKSVVIMKPTWPVGLFDLCLIPRHDLDSEESSERIILTLGALNRIPEEIPPKQRRGVILIGGPSKNHGWAAAPLIEAVTTVIRSRQDLAWTVGDSRRTPEGFLSQLAASGLPAECVPMSKTTPDWLPAQLLSAEEVWVTEDSVSMVFEAITAGNRVGLLPVPTSHDGNDVSRALQQLVLENYATTYSAWLKTGRQLPPPKRLHETARCAELVLERLFANRRQ